MRIAVIGTGYVGLVAGTCFAELGNSVTCIDIDEDKIAKLKQGIVPIYEPGLEELVKRNVHDGRLRFTTDYTVGMDRAQIAFIAVGTPPGENGSADVKYVLAAARSIAAEMKGYTVIVDKSTVPVGTAAKVREAIEAITGCEFDVVSNPEFLKEGAAIDDFLKPNRVVIGADSERAAHIMDELYEPFVRTGNPIIHMDVASAELTKYAANAMLATRISFMNE
ncbi:MAG: UDP-glucose/GDP-mannose dehydrogenase family protein, partial [Planctomycetota bacterium]